jgi:hypothetical protein
MEKFGAPVPNRNLETVEVFGHYDGIPLMTHFRNPTDKSDVFEMWVDCDDSKTYYRFMQVTLSKEKMEALVNNKLSLRNAFKQAFTVFLVDVPGYFSNLTEEDKKSYWVSINDVPEDYFALEGSFLDT